MYKWCMKDDTLIILCETCSKKEYRDLVIREPWKAKDKNKTVECERCGRREIVNF